MSRADWLEAGVAVLAGGGAEALTIDRLCSLTGRTKGSFYHHFKAMVGFEEALLRHWADANLRRVEVAEQEADAPLLEHLALGLEAGLEAAVRRWAAFSLGARQAVAEVDSRRIGWLTSGIGSEDIARLHYAAFLGLLILGADGDDLGRLMEILRQRLI